MPTSDECKNTSDELYGYIAKLLADQPFFKNLVGGLKAGNVEISMFRKLVNKKNRGGMDRRDRSVYSASRQRYPPSVAVY